MSEPNHYHALLAEGSAVPTLLCGRCHSILSRSRISRNRNAQPGGQCQTIGLCSADDCGAVNCCDDALARIDNPERRLFDLAC
ncbi:hypothetical protein [Marinobacter sp. C2H3]|uniref:hypothetical protein n=1 Tax=Marinobacter sp. C2H3 TaxID=3119003 RepID=UPI00300E7F83